MWKPIDPTVDCVFKAILGSPHHRNLLVHFLNAILGYDGDERVVEVIYRNPFNPKENFEDKLSIVDVKAVDQKGREFQVEVQVANHAALPERMLYTWASIYAGTLKEGMAYSTLRPVISIWLLVESLFPKSDLVHLPFGLYSTTARISLTPHCEIHVLQLMKSVGSDKINDDKDRWIGFFREGKNLSPDHLPEWMQNSVMREAMDVLREFSEKENNYHLYLSRMDRQRVEITQREEFENMALALAQAQREKEQAFHRAEQAQLENEKTQREKERAFNRAEQAQREKEQAFHRAEHVQLEKEQALLEVERLRGLLKNAGVDLDRG